MLGMAKQLYYRVRTFSPDGKVRTGSTYYGLTMAVRCLSAATGQQWPYQVIHRALKGAPLWASAYVVPASALGPGGAYICSVEETESDANIALDGSRLLPVAAPSAPTPLDILLEQANQDALAVEMIPCWSCKKPHPAPDLNMGVCDTCIDTPPPLVELPRAAKPSAPDFIAHNKQLDKNAGPGGCFECGSPASSRVQGVCSSCVESDPTIRRFLGL